MKKKRRSQRLLVPLFLLPLLIAFFFWELDGDPVTIDSETGDQGAAALPETILEEATLTQFDTSGAQVQRLSSAILTAKDADQSIDFRLPVLTLEDQADYWIASSAYGRYDQQNNLLKLSGDVELQQQNGERPVKITTDYLDYFPEQRLAETDALVIVTSEGHRVQSDGARVDIANSVYTLLKNVRSTHAPL